MRKAALPLAVTGSVFLLALQAVPASAQATRTWVSGVGDDANPCSRTAPCKTFAGAISKTASGGEIDCLDPGGFGAVTITKGMTIDCGGVTGGILSSATNGVVISAGVNDKIVLRNMIITGAGTTLGLNGIRFLAGLELTVENVRFEKFSGTGIDVSKTASANVYVRNSNFTQMQKGIRLFTGAGGVNAQIDGVHIDGVSSNGIEVASGSTVASVSNSVIANAAGSALITTGGGFINADRNIIAKNGTGANSNASGGSIRISNNAFNDNGTAFAIAAGATISSTATASNTVIGNVGANPNGGAIPLK